MLFNRLIWRVSVRACCDRKLNIFYVVSGKAGNGFALKRLKIPRKSCRYGDESHLSPQSVLRPSCNWPGRLRSPPADYRPSIFNKLHTVLKTTPVSLVNMSSRKCRCTFNYRRFSILKLYLSFYAAFFIRPLKFQLRNVAQSARVDKNQLNITFYFKNDKILHLECNASLPHQDLDR